MLAKEECIESLNYLRNDVCSVCAGEYPHCWSRCNSKPHYSKLEKLINEHFDLQLTSSECDLIISSLNPLEEELGMDVTLLINKVRKLQSKLPKQEGVVECVEFD